jgi:hypothetical protein
VTDSVGVFYADVHDCLLELVTQDYSCNSSIGPKGHS